MPTRSNPLFRALLRQIEKGGAPKTRKAIWKIWYQILARFWTNRTLTFMNYGFEPADGDPVATLAPTDEANRPFIGLYHHLASTVPMEGTRVLEVGCGRGGGAAYMARYLGPREVIGLDYSSRAVDLATSTLGDIANLRFRTGDAEALPFPDDSFDIVVNVESSHCYANMRTFVAEVARVLRPGGTFAWADMCAATMRAGIDASFDHPDLIPMNERDIGANVVASLDRTHDMKTRMIAGVPLVKSLLREFAGTKTSLLYKGLANGSVLYRSKILVKRVQ